MHALPWFAAFSAFTSIAITLLGGQDRNFDLVTYHYYLGYSAFSDRLQLDFLPASFQGYQSPLPYALLYWLDSNGVPPAANAALHATLHALNLILLFALAQSLLGADGTNRKIVSVAALWAMGLAAPIYWRLVGTSFADLTTSVFVLGGLWVVARAMADRSQSPKARILNIILGAALVGTAAGMRIHNAIYVIALFCAFGVAGFASMRERFRTIIAFAGGTLTGWALCFLPWASKIYREFGNPLFPLYNGFFQSPDFPPANLPLTSFVPASLQELVTLPFRMAAHAPWLYTEVPLPDVRPALLAMCMAIWLMLRMLAAAGARSGLPARFQRLTIRRNDEGDDGVRIILAFFWLSAALWLATSSNARYGVALFLLAGPVCGLFLYRLLPQHFVILVVAAVVLWQALLLHTFFRQHRPDAGQWTSSYFDWNLPTRFKSEPSLYLSFGFNTASTLAPHVHPESSHVNLVGQYTPVPDGPESSRIRHLMAMPGRKIFGVFDYLYTQQDVAGARSVKTYFSDHVRMWGLAFAEKDCELLSQASAAPSWSKLNRIAGVAQAPRLPAFIVCELQPTSGAERERALSQLDAFRGRLSRLTATCPHYFGKQLHYTRVYRRWIVSSFASFETTFDFEDNGPFYLQQMRPPYIALELGRTISGEIVPNEADCNAWFSRLATLSRQPPSRK